MLMAPRAPFWRVVPVTVVVLATGEVPSCRSDLAMTIIPIPKAQAMAEAATTCFAADDINRQLSNQDRAGTPVGIPALAILAITTEVTVAGAAGAAFSPIASAKTADVQVIPRLANARRSRSMARLRRIFAAASLTPSTTAISLLSMEAPFFERGFHAQE
jgi:hypothetical protein